MKKRLGVLLLAIITVVSMTAFTGCGSKDNPYSGMNLNDYIKVGQYKGIEVKKTDVKVTKQQMGDAIREALDAAKTSEDLKKGDKIKDGDTLNIDYSGELNGKKFEGGTAQGQSLTIGSGSFIDGFESGLVGHKIGEKNIKLNLAFPLNYQQKDLAGKDVVFTVTVNSGTREVKPEYNKEFVKSQGDYKNEAEFEKALEEKLLKKNKADAKNEQQNEIWSKVLSNTKVKKYPKEMVEHYMTVYDEQLDYIAEQQGTTRKAIMEQYYGITSEKVLKKQFKESARLLVKQEMTIEYIAEKEGLEFTKDEADKLKADIEKQGYDDEKVEQETGRTMDQYLRIELLYGKTRDFLYKEAVIK